MRNTLGRLMNEGLIEKMPLEPLAYVLWGTFFEAGVYIAHAENSATAQEETAELLVRILAGLRVHVPDAYTAGPIDTNTNPS